MAKTQEAGFVNKKSLKFLAEEKEGSEHDVINTPEISFPRLSSFNLPVGSPVDGFSCYRFAPVLLATVSAPLPIPC